MSTTQRQRSDETEEEDSLEWAENHREELKREAESDAPHAWVAESILQRLDEDEEEEDEEAGDS